MRLVCTDLDRTLLPNGVQPESAHARPVLWHMLRTHNVLLAYVSGRDLGRVLDAIERYDLPVPAAIVADVGTSIYTRDVDGWVPSAHWQTKVSRDWNGRSAGDIRRLLADVAGLQEQEPDRQSAFKQSYYYPENVDEASLLRAVDERLAAPGISASLVCSHDPEKGVGLLDVLPRSATKREAVAYLQSLFDISPADVMFAGDSGNDVDAICALHPSVLVANADASTREAVSIRSRTVSQSKNICFAEGSVEVAGLDALNGNYAAGIIEGLLHFRPDWADHLCDAQWVEEALGGNPTPKLQSGLL